MKSTFKRILALVMVLCTVAAWMIPGVSAEDSAAAETPASLVVDFKTSFDNAGVAADAYLQGANVAPLANAYETNGWQLYVDSTGTPSKSNSAYPVRAAGSRKLFQMRSNSASEIGRVPLLFKAPGTGDYTLSLTFAVNSVAAVRASLAGAFIMEAPETPYTRYNIPFHTNENAKAVISFAPNATDDEGNYIYNAGSVLSSETTVALESGKEYILIFFIQQNGDTTSYADYSAFSLTPYVEVEETTAPEETTTAPEETTTVPEESLPEIEHKYDDLTVDFSDVSDLAGVTANTFWSAGYPAKTEAVYAQTGWTATTIYNTYPPRYFATGKMQFYSNSVGNTKYAASKFVAPGTGDYILGLTPGVASAADARAEIAGAYIIPYSDTFDKYSFVNYTTVDNAVVLNAEQLKAGEEISGTNTVSLVTGQEYYLVFFVYDNVDGKGKADFEGFSLTRQWPAASIGSTNYPTLGDALNVAVSGDTIVLGQDAFEYEVNLPAGVTVDLNGKTLNTGAFVGTAKDSADGKGLLISEADAVVTAADGQVALWDIKPSAPGYRFFNYSLTNYGVSAGENNASGVDAEIDFYDYERNFLATSFDEYGEVAKGAGDYKIKDVADNIRADYNDGKTNWRYEYCSATYQMSRGGQCFSWGNKAISQFAIGYTAIRIHAPADGKVSFTLKTSSSGQDGAFDMYIVKASDVEALCTDYDAAHEAYVAALTTAADRDSAACTSTELHTAFTTAMNNNSVALSGVSDGNAYTGSYKFEADEEYILIFNMGTNDKLNFQSISFKRYEQYGMAQSFVSKLTFTNTDAYDYIATGDSGLRVGFEMIWNGVNKFFEYDDATVAAWAQAEKDNADKDYGFYIRMSGFEALTESGELTGVAYMATENQWFNAEGETMTYEHTVAE